MGATWRTGARHAPSRELGRHAVGNPVPAASVMRGPCVFPEQNFGARNDQCHIALELIQDLAFEPISGLAGLWWADCSPGAGFCRRIALTSVDRQDVGAELAASADTPAPVGSALTYGLVSACLFGVAVWGFGKFYSIELLPHAAPLAVSALLPFAFGLWLRGRRKRRLLRAHSGA